MRETPGDQGKAPYGGHKQELARLDPDIEREKRDGNIHLRKPGVFQGACETKSMQQAKGEGDHPGVALGQAPLPRALLDQLAGHEGDTEGDGGLHGLLRRAETSQSAACEREAYG